MKISVLKIHPTIKQLITKTDWENLPVVGSLKHFLISWEKITSTTFILHCTKNVLWIWSHSLKKSLMENVIFCSDGRGSLDGSENSENVAVSSNQKSFFNPKANSELNIFISKEEFRASPCDKSKETKENIPYKNFKIEGLFLLKKRILKGNWICKDAYFSVSLHPEFQNLVRFQWFISGSKNVYKTVEIQIALFIKLMMRLVIFSTIF